MRLIKIQLGSESLIWSHGDILLTQKERISPLIDLDSLSDEDKKIFIAAQNKLEIIIKNEDGKRIQKFTEKEINEKCLSVDIEDIEEKEDELEEILTVNCITVGDEEENLEQKEQEKKELKEKIKKEAEKILSKNGNTVKKTISELDISDDYFYKLIKSCYNIERQKENPRKSIIKEISKKLGELNE